MSKFARSFRELEVYQLAFSESLEIFECSKSFPQEEKYALTSQIRDACRSVSANIGEAWGKRRYPKHFASKLTDAVAEGNETMVWLDYAFHHGYIDEDFRKTKIEKYEYINNMLNRMIEDSDKWCF